MMARECPNRASDSGPDSAEDLGPMNYYEALSEAKDAIQDAGRDNPILLARVVRLRRIQAIERAIVMLKLAEGML